jgi:hypothetical protein
MATVALAPRTHVELQHDVEIVGRWQRRTNVWREVTSPAGVAKRLRKREIPQAGLIRYDVTCKGGWQLWLSEIERRWLPFARSHGAKEPC